MASDSANVECGSGNEISELIIPDSDTLILKADLSHDR